MSQSSQFFGQSVAPQGIVKKTFQCLSPFYLCFHQWLLHSTKSHLSPMFRCRTCFSIHERRRRLASGINVLRLQIEMVAKVFFLQNLANKCALLQYQHQIELLYLSQRPCHAGNSNFHTTLDVCKATLRQNNTSGKGVDTSSSQR